MYNNYICIFIGRGEQMKTIFSVLKEKLNILGYNENVANSIIRKFDLALIEKQVSDEKDYEKVVEIDEFEEPTVEIIELFLNIKYDVKYIYLFDLYFSDFTTDKIQIEKYEINPKIPASNVIFSKVQ